MFARTRRAAVDEEAAAKAVGEERVAAWLAANPGAKAWDADDGWRGTVPVDGERWIAAGPCARPGELADALEARAADAAEVRAVEAEHPGWLARRWSDGAWQAVRPFGPDDVPLHVTVSDPSGLRKAIAAAAVIAA
jgi:hypothetical protein